MTRFFTSADAMPGELQRALEASAPARGRFGEPALFFMKTTSTNDVAAGLADRGAPEGTMVVAQAQTAGRGRQGREWFSPPGAGLYVSLVCRDPGTAPLLTLAAGVAVAEGVRRATGLPVGIKWPNDIVIAEGSADRRPRKLAGILAEGCTSGGVLQYVVLGFGINLRRAAYPAGISGLATSLEAELGRPVESGDLLAEILVALNQLLSDSSAGQRAWLLSRWRALAPSSVGRRVEWSAGGTTRHGTTAGIDEHGALLVNTHTGLERIQAGEVLWR